MKHLLTGVAVALLIGACNTADQGSALEPGPAGIEASTDPLPSWNESVSKQAIVDFVQRTTTEG